MIILMGSYNGAAYIEEQIQSIQQQTIQDWQLIVRDDNSSDHTRELVQQYADQDSRIKLLEDYSHKGVINNFGELLNYAKNHTQAEYYAFADQDDVWLPEKLDRSINKISESNSNDIPSLVFTDVNVVDTHLNTLTPSYLAMLGFDEKNSMDIKQLCWKNIAPGCACLFNKKFFELLKPLPESKKIIMHDAYLVQVAASCGKLEYVNQPLMLYRQHGKNEAGANIDRYQNKKNRNTQKIRHKTIAQLITLKEQYVEHMHPEAKKYIVQQTSFLNLLKMKIKRKWQSSFLAKMVN